MEEETEGLEILIQQRNNRRRLMRMISWGRPGDDASKQSDIIDERPPIDDEVSTGDEEFYSAEEGSDIDEEDEEPVDSEEEPINLSERKKPSKKKRKRLKQLLKSLEEPVETEQFSFLSFFAQDFKSKDLDQEIGNGAYVQRHVPTLNELCMDCCQKLEIRHNLPPGLKRLMTVYRYEELLRHQQIEWSQRMLMKLEKKFEEKLKWKPDLQGVKNGVCSEICAIRDLQKMANTNNYYNRYRYSSFSSKTSVFPLIWPQPVKNNNSSYNREAPIAPSDDYFGASIGLETVANLIDLMLPIPGTVRTKPRWKGDHDLLEDEDRRLAVALSNIQRRLKKRHPLYLGYIYGVAEGYALWVRGDIGNAEESFKRFLSRRDVDVHLKSLIRNEVGRMFMMFGDLVKASQYFLEAAVDEEDDELKDATSQALTLIAMQTDTGLLTGSKAQESAAAWSALLKREHSFIKDLATIATESAMRVYGGHVIDHQLTSRWHRDILERLNNQYFAANCSRLAQAFVHAMMGQEVASREKYTNYLSCFSSVFYEPEKTKYKSNYLLEPILTQMRDRPRPIPPIKLLWRTQMCYPTFSYEKYPIEVDYHSKPTDDCSLHLNLHLSDEGYLTGDMAMQLPPLRGVYLDPYTGGVCLPHVPLKATPWKDISVHQPVHLETYSPRETFRLPRLLRVVDNEKCIVDFFIAADLDGTSQTATLTWIGSDGMRMTLDLRKMVRSAIKKELEMLIEKRGEKEGGQWVVERMDALNVCVERGWNPTLNNIENYIRHRLNVKEFDRKKKEMSDNKEKKKGSKKLFKARKPEFNNFGLVLDTFYTYGETVLLQLRPGKGYSLSDQSPIIVIVNCSSVDSFKEAKIHCNLHHLLVNFSWTNQPVVITSSLLPFEGHTQLQHFPHAEIFIIGGAKINKDKEMSVFDKDGNIVADEVFLRKGRRGPQIKFYIIGTHYFYIREKDEECGIQKRAVNEGEDNEQFCQLADVSELHQVEDVFVVKMALGLCLVNPLTMDLLKLNRCSESLTYSLESNSTIIMGEDLEVTTFTSKRKKTGTNRLGEVVQIAVGVRDHVFILEVPFDGKSCQYCSEVDVILQVDVPGIPREISFISYEAGFLVAASLTEDLTDAEYRNHLFQFSYDGVLMGIMPFLGRGPHRFTPIYLEESKEQKGLGEEAGNSGWHVFFVDGHGALACFNASATGH